MDLAFTTLGGAGCWRPVVGRVLHQPRRGDRTPTEPMLDRIQARLPVVDESPLGEIYDAALRYYMLAPLKPDDQ